ncbi:Protein Hook -like protein 2 [Trichinella spiralis]|uniref:Protein Hook-like protein 2 n=1 Tax=Trichinella spiralis TaxID=6334 RepID=A0A0V1BNS2_TRISP|nr:Protein Hook -like protein 2 [Trichinella spiralis]
MGKKREDENDIIYVGNYSSMNGVALYLNLGYGSIRDSTNIEHDYDCLLKWMMSLQANVTHIELNELTSGRAFIDALRVIDSNYFNDAWMEVFKDANYEQREWRLRANVLRKILKSVLKYNEEICNNVISKNILPNVMVIARDGSKEEIIIFELSWLLLLMVPEEMHTLIWNSKVTKVVYFKQNANQQWLATELCSQRVSGL